MNEFLENSLFAGVTISLLAYMAGAFLKKKFKIALLNPLLISIILSIVVLVTADIDYDVYNAGASYLSWFFLRFLCMSSGSFLKRIGKQLCLVF